MEVTIRLRWQLGTVTLCVLTVILYGHHEYGGMPSVHFFAESDGSCGVLSCSYTEYDVGAKQPSGGFIQGHGHGIQINTCIYREQEEVSSHYQKKHRCSLGHPDANRPAKPPELKRHVGHRLCQQVGQK